MKTIYNITDYILGTHFIRYVLVAEEEVEGDVLPHQIVAEAVPEVSDAVHRRHQVRARRVDRQTHWSHPSVWQKRIN